MERQNVTRHTYQGVSFKIYKVTGRGWLADIDGACPGGRRLRADAIKMARHFIEHGSMCPGGHP